MARQRSDRKLIHDRIDRNINAINESKRRLEEVLGMIKEASHGEEETYIEEQAEIALVLTLYDHMLEVNQKLYEVF